MLVMMLRINFPTLLQTHNNKILHGELFQQSMDVFCVLEHKDHTGIGSFDNNGYK